MIRLSEIWSQERINDYKASGFMEITCPICKNETFDNWAICPHCGWEYDERKGYSDANRCYKWWYKLKYKFKLIRNLKRDK